MPLPENFTFRLLSKNDASGYRQLRLEGLLNDPDSFLSTFSNEQNKSEVDFGWELHQASYQKPFGFYGLFDQEQLIGCLQLAPSWLIKQRHIVFIFLVYISPAYRGRKLSKVMFEEILTVIKAMPTIEQIHLSCNGKNSKAQQLYHQLGFTQCGRKPKSVKDEQGNYDDEIDFIMQIKTS